MRKNSKDIFLQLYILSNAIEVAFNCKVLIQFGIVFYFPGARLETNYTIQSEYFSYYLFIYLFIQDYYSRLIKKTAGKKPAGKVPVIIFPITYLFRIIPK